MSEKIRSVHAMFEGELFDKPKVAIVLREDPELGPIYSCPGCGEEIDGEACDVLGAEWGCAFCPKCSCEFEL